MVSSTTRESQVRHAYEESDTTPTHPYSQGRKWSDRYFDEMNDDREIVMVFDHELEREIPFKMGVTFNRFCCWFGPWGLPLGLFSIIITFMLILIGRWFYFMPYLILSILFFVIIPIATFCIKYTNERSLVRARHTALCRNGLLVIVDKHKKGGFRDVERREILIPFDKFTSCRKNRPDDVHVCCNLFRPQVLYDCVVEWDALEVCVVQSLKDPDAFIRRVIEMKKQHDVETCREEIKNKNGEVRTDFTAPIPASCQDRKSTDSFFEQMEDREVIVGFDHDFEKEINFKKRVILCRYFLWWGLWTIPLGIAAIAMSSFLFWIDLIICCVFSVVFFLVAPATSLCLKFRHARSLATARHTALCRNGLLVVVDKHRKSGFGDVERREILIPFEKFTSIRKTQPGDVRVCCRVVKPRELYDCVIESDALEMCVVQSLTDPDTFVHCVMEMKKQYDAHGLVGGVQGATLA